MPIENIYSIDFFYDLLYVMFLIGLVVFVSLFFVDAGYGKMRSEKWGPAISNKVGWLLMECPVFFVMLYLYFKSFPLYGGVTKQAPYWLFFLFFEFYDYARSHEMTLYSDSVTSILRRNTIRSYTPPLG